MKPLDTRYEHKGNSMSFKLLRKKWPDGIGTCAIRIMDTRSRRYILHSDEWDIKEINKKWYINVVDLNSSVRKPSDGVIEVKLDASKYMIFLDSLKVIKFEDFR